MSVKLPEETRRACERKQLEHDALDIEIQKARLDLSGLEQQLQAPMEWNRFRVISGVVRQLKEKISVLQAKQNGLEDWLIDNECPSWEQLS